jgi:HAD superfamily hydrolase (TIGR01490 family)
MLNSLYINHPKATESVLITRYHVIITIMLTKKPAALFDLDNTLIHGSSLYYLVKGLVDLGELSRKQLFKFALAHFKFIKSRTENIASFHHITQRGLGLVRGQSQLQLAESCEKIVSKFLLPRLNQSILAEVQEHQRNGVDTWVVTAAPTDLATLVARSIGMTGAIGTDLATKDGRYSGELASGLLHGPRKAEAIVELAKSKNYELSKSYAYSDSINDLPLLLSVGTPCVVNANAELLRIARKNSWRELANVG